MAEYIKKHYIKNDNRVVEHVLTFRGKIYTCKVVNGDNKVFNMQEQIIAEHGELKHEFEQYGIEMDFMIDNHEEDILNMIKTLEEYEYKCHT